MKAYLTELSHFFNKNNELKRIKRMALMKQDVLRISQICCARAIVAYGEQFVRFRIIRKIREIRFNSLFLKI